jgi:hypothetical protein
VFIILVVVEEEIFVITKSLDFWYLTVWPDTYPCVGMYKESSRSLTTVRIKLWLVPVPTEVKSITGPCRD